MSAARVMRYRHYLLWSFLMFGVVSIVATAVIMNLSVGWSEDETLRLQLETIAESSKEAGVYQGTIDKLPPSIRDVVADQPAGYSEIEFPRDTLEAHVLKSGQGPDATYAAIVLNRQIGNLPVVVVLLVWTLFCVAIATLSAVFLARRLSAPVEQLVSMLDSGNGEQKLSILELQVLQNRLMETQEQQRDQLAREASFNRTVSHEIRTPLATVQNAIELLQGRVEGEDQATLDRMRRASTRLHDTVEVLLQIARDEHHLRSRYSNFEAGLQDQIQQHDTDVVVEVDLSVETLRLIGDQWPAALLITGVLLDNAIRHADQKPVQIRLFEQRLAVIDAGPGMTQSTQDALAQGSVIPGRLGFAIVNRVCERCGWMLRVVSDSHGTEVCIDLSPATAPPI